MYAPLALLEVQVGVHVVHGVEVRLRGDGLAVAVIQVVHQLLLLGAGAVVAEGGLEGGVGPGADGAHHLLGGALLTAEGALDGPPLQLAQAQAQALPLEGRAQLLLRAVVVAEGGRLVLRGGDQPVRQHGVPALVQLAVHVCRALHAVPPQVPTLRVLCQRGDDALAARAQLGGAVPQQQLPVGRRLRGKLLRAGGVAREGVVHAVLEGGGQLGEPVHGGERGADVHALVRQALLKEGAPHRREEDVGVRREGGAGHGELLQAERQEEERVEVVVGLVFEAHLELALGGQHGLELVDKGHLGSGVGAAKVCHAHGAVAVLGQGQGLDALAHHVHCVHHHVKAAHRELAVGGRARLAEGNVRPAEGVHILLRPGGGGGGGGSAAALEHARALDAHGGDVEGRLLAEHQAGKGAAEHGAELEGAAVARGEHRHVGVVGEGVQHEHRVLAHGVRRRHHVHAVPVHLAPLLAEEAIDLLGEVLVRLVLEVLHRLEAVLLGGEVHPHLGHAVLAGEPVEEAVVLTKVEPLGGLRALLQLVVAPVHAPHLNVELGVEVLEDVVGPGTRRHHQLVSDVPGAGGGEDVVLVAALLLPDVDDAAVALEVPRALLRRHAHHLLARQAAAHAPRRLLEQPDVLLVRAHAVKAVRQARGLVVELVGQVAALHHLQRAGDGALHRLAGVRLPVEEQPVHVQQLAPALRLQLVPQLEALALQVGEELVRVHLAEHARVAVGRPLLVGGLLARLQHHALLPGGHLGQLVRRRRARHAAADDEDIDGLGGLVEPAVQLGADGGGLAGLAHRHRHVVPVLRCVGVARRLVAHVQVLAHLGVHHVVAEGVRHGGAEVVPVVVAPLQRIHDDGARGGDVLRHKPDAAVLGEGAGELRLEGHVGSAHDGLTLELRGHLLRHHARRRARREDVHLKGGEVLNIGDVGAPLDVGALRDDVGGVHGGAVLDQALRQEGANLTGALNENLKVLRQAQLLSSAHHRGVRPVRGRLVGVHGRPDPREHERRDAVQVDHVPVCGVDIAARVHTASLRG
mmetsp:Transcript_37770/g.82145  ORF Transcript_37770/g.82145 Transcript_37770/m.82145 type:complete len:1031 (+) Transcript_37770:416-3508(+)